MNTRLRYFFKTFFILTSTILFKQSAVIIRHYKYALAVLICVGLLAACQKEFTIEGGVEPGSGTQTGTAKFLISGAPNACGEAVLHGSFTKGINVDSTCYITINVAVTDTGSYTVATATVNGVSFSASGKFAATGVQTIQLQAAGTPVKGGTFTFKAGSNGCSFSTTVIDPGTIAAEFTLSGSPTACTLDSIGGTYNTGVPLGDTNTVTLTAHVTKAGNYSIATATVNGIKFSAAGRLDTGMQTITLKGTGTPVKAEASTFTAGNNGCTFQVQVVTPPPAVFTLTGAGACQVPLVSGAYQVNGTLTTANTVTIHVDVTTPGAYTIKTNTVNGMMFIALGKFTAAGTNVAVELSGVGKAETPGKSSFTIDGTTCTFDVEVSAEPAGIFSCAIDGLAYDFAYAAEAGVKDDLLNAGPDLYVDGFYGEPNGGYRPEFSISIQYLDGSPITPGMYDEKSAIGIKGYTIAVNYKAVNGTDVVIWGTTSNLPPLVTNNPPFTINVTSVTATRVKGTFSGTLTNIFQGSTATKKVTDGSFDVAIH